MTDYKEFTAVTYPVISMDFNRSFSQSIGSEPFTTTLADFRMDMHNIPPAYGRMIAAYSLGFSYNYVGIGTPQNTTGTHNFNLFANVGRAFPWGTVSVGLNGFYSLYNWGSDYGGILSGNYAYIGRLKHYFNYTLNLGGEVEKSNVLGTLYAYNASANGITGLSRLRTFRLSDTETAFYAATFNAGVGVGDSYSPPVAGSPLYLSNVSTSAATIAGIRQSYTNHYLDRYELALRGQVSSVRYKHATLIASAYTGYGGAGIEPQGNGVVPLELNLQATSRGLGRLQLTGVYGFATSFGKGALPYVNTLSTTAEYRYPIKWDLMAMGTAGNTLTQMDAGVSQSAWLGGDLLWQLSGLSVLQVHGQMSENASHVGSASLTYEMYAQYNTSFANRSSLVANANYTGDLIAGTATRGISTAYSCLIGAYSVGANYTLSQMINPQGSSLDEKVMLSVSRSWATAFNRLW